VIPVLHPRSERALEIRGKLSRLAQLNIGGRVLELYNADLIDLEMIAIIEDELRQSEENPAQTPREE